MKSKKVIGLLVIATMISGLILPSTMAFAEETNAIGIGSNLNPWQKQEVLNYLNPVKGSYKNANIEGTVSVYIQPTLDGGINIKTADLMDITPGMIADALVTLGIYNGNMVIVSPFKISGEGVINDIARTYEEASNVKIDKEKINLANSELLLDKNILTNNKDKALEVSSFMMNVKLDALKGRNIKNDINDIAKTYKVTLTEVQKNEIESLMNKVVAIGLNKEEAIKSVQYLKGQNDELLKKADKLNGFFNNLGADMDSVENFFNNLFNGKAKNYNGIYNEVNPNTVIGQQVVVMGNTDKIYLNELSPTLEIASPNKKDPVEYSGPLSVETHAKIEGNKISHPKTLCGLQEAIINVAMEQLKTNIFTKGYVLNSKDEILYRANLNKVLIPKLYYGAITRSARVFIVTSNISITNAKVEVRDTEIRHAINIPVKDIIPGFNRKMYISVSFSAH